MQPIQHPPVIFQISEYKGEKVNRTDLDAMGYFKRILLFSLALFLSGGTALCCSPRVQKLWAELKEGKKITVLSKEEVEASQPAKKVEEIREKQLVQEEVKAGVLPEKKLMKVEPKIEVPPQIHAQPQQNPQEVEIEVEEKIMAPDEILKAQLKDFDVLKEKFSKINSSELIDLNAIYPSPTLHTRQNFLKAFEEGKLEAQPVVLAKSDFVPNAMVEHLMRHKQFLKLGEKYSTGDCVSNMEGALHTFLIPITPIKMSADYQFKGGHNKAPLENGQGREVILSASIQPDFEFDGEREVVMKIVEVKDKPLEGKILPYDFKPLRDKTTLASGYFSSMVFDLNLSGYEKLLQQHMVYHLTSDQRLPSLNEIKPEKIHSPEDVKKLLEHIIKTDEAVDPSALKNHFMKIDNLGSTHIISLETLFNLYVHQIRNEFTVLEGLLPQGYVYTINPPSIFLAKFGKQNLPILNRLQLLALKMQHQRSPLKNLKAVGIDNFGDAEVVDLYKATFPKKAQDIFAKNDLFRNDGLYSVNADWALVIHNNSDAFGQNIESEGPTSLDGVIGSYSTAAVNLNRDNEDLVKHVVTVA